MLNSKLLLLISTLLVLSSNNYFRGTSHSNQVLASEEENPDECENPDFNTETTKDEHEKEEKGEQKQENTTRRLISVEELSTKTGENNSSIWLSVMGQVYDVTAGENFYQKGKGYSFFAARDASASFVTGKFNAEGLKTNLTNVTKSQIQGIEEWRKFYANSEKYHFVGVLTDGRFYDEEGKPTYMLKKWRMNIKKMEEEKKKK